MSGRGLPPGRAPVRLLTVLGDQPIGFDDQGHQIRPSMEFVQFLQRLISYIGQPASSGAQGITLSALVGAASSAATAVQSGSIDPGFPSLPPPSDVVYLGNGSRVLDGYGSPNGAVFGSVGDLFLQRDGSPSAVAWAKASGEQTDAGWVPGAGSAIYAPLANGDLPGSELVGYPDGMFKGPTLVSDPSGACVMVQIR